MDYESLLEETESLNVDVREKPLKYNDGRIRGNKVLIRRDMIQNQKACVLAEEIGHYKLNTGNILNQEIVSIRKREYRARLWAYNKMIGMDGLIRAYKCGCSSKAEIADCLGVTEQFLQEAIECYKNKYGMYREVDNYMIFFEPLGVFELYK